MYSIKGGWVGQTFALAASNDLGGKKARIRRSKEERKAMVKSFIQRYQKSNNGNFPSLNLTHKEVGGSYYIVRDIVRDLIQENRVLGTSTLTTYEHNDFATLEHHPLGSISTEPQIQMFSSEESLVMAEANHTSTSVDLGSNGGLYEHGNQRENIAPVFNKDPLICGKEPNGPATTHSSNVDDETRGYQFLRSSGKMAGGPLDIQLVSEDTITRYKENVLDKEPEELISTNGSCSFPEGISIYQHQNSWQVSTRSQVEISTVEDISNGSNKPILNDEDCKGNKQLEAQVQDSAVDMKDAENKQEVKDLLTKTEEDVIVETFPLRPVSINIHGPYKGLRESRGTAIHLEEEKTGEDELNLLLEASMSTKTGDDIADSSGAFSSAGKKLINNPNEIHHDNLVFVGTVDSPKKISPMGTTSTKTRLNVQHDSSSMKGSTPTLNRINLETWDGRLRADTNPFLALVKSMITAFVKFWTE